MLYVINLRLAKFYRNLKFRLRVGFKPIKMLMFQTPSGLFSALVDFRAKVI